MWCVGDLEAGPISGLQELFAVTPHHAALSPVSACDGRKLLVEGWEHRRGRCKFQLDMWTSWLWKWCL